MIIKFFEIKHFIDSNKSFYDLLDSNRQQTPGAQGDTVILGEESSYEVVPGSLCSTSPSACATVDMVAVPQGTIIHSLILSLGTCDGEGSLVFKQGA